MSNHHTVAHAWTHQTGRNRNGHNMYYEGATIYSYGSHFAIARLTQDAHGNQCVLFTTRSYSTSTAKHKGIVRRACSHLPIYEVTIPTCAPDALDHEIMIRNASDCIAKAKRARVNGDWLLQQANTWLDKANALNTAFNLGQPVANLETLGVVIADLDARLAAARATEGERRRKIEAERHEQEAKAREAWLRGESVRYHGRDENGNAYLRVRGDELQTSLGAAVPLDHAVKAFRTIKACRDRGATWTRNGHTIHVGHFQVDHINADGSFRAGCHSFAWSEVERVASLLGLLTQEDA